MQDDDKMMAEDLRAKAEALRDAMTLADSMGIEFGFTGIQKGPNGRFRIMGMTIRKRLIDNAD